MDCKVYLTEYKRVLKQQLTYKEMLLNKYALNGYISRKTIKGKAYNYYQYRTENGKIISCRLTEDKQALYESARVCADRLQKNINRIQNMLKYFSGVPDDGIEISQSLPFSMRRFRLLDHAVGISPSHHVLFKIIAKPSLGEYGISYTKHNKSHDVPMVYIDETAINKIPEFIHTAGLIVDRTVGITETIHTSEDTLSGVSSAGIKYTASINANGYSACFKLFRSPRTMTGVLPTLYDSEYKNPAYRLFIEKEIDDLFWKEYMSRLAQEVTRESG